MNNEPVAIVKLGGDVEWLTDVLPYNAKLYTHPANPKYDPETGEPLIDGYPLFSGLPTPPAKTLTDEEIVEIFQRLFNVNKSWETLVFEFARAILRKASEK